MSSGRSGRIHAVRPVFVVTGPSGAGKGTLIRALVERLPELEVAISATTRSRRPGEVDGREYWFLSEAEFADRIDEGAFLEWVEYVSHKRYGTLRSELDRIDGNGHVAVLELEIDGALLVQEQVPGACVLFIARHQLEQAHRFRYMVRNDDLTRASEVLAAIVERELVLAGTMAPR